VIVRFPSTGAIGEVTAETEINTEYIGDMAGTWFRIRWDDTGECTWNQASSVEVILPDPVHQPELKLDPEEHWYAMNDGWVT
jgi:hypothetical protein